MVSAVLWLLLLAQDREGLSLRGELAIFSGDLSLNPILKVPHFLSYGSGHAHHRLHMSKMSFILGIAFLLKFSRRNRITFSKRLLSLT